MYIVTLTGQRCLCAQAYVFKLFFCSFIDDHYKVEKFTHVSVSSENKLSLTIICHLCDSFVILSFCLTNLKF